MGRPDVLMTRPIMDEPLERLRERCDVFAALDGREPPTLLNPEAFTG